MQRVPLSRSVRKNIKLEGKPKPNLIAVELDGRCSKDAQITHLSLKKTHMKQRGWVFSKKLANIDS